MIASHLVALVLFSALVSFVFALLMRDSAAERRAFGQRVFSALVASAIITGWLLALLR